VKSRSYASKKREGFLEEKNKNYIFSAAIIIIKKIDKIYKKNFFFIKKPKNYRLVTARVRKTGKIYNYTIFTIKDHFLLVYVINS